MELPKRFTTKLLIGSDEINIKVKEYKNKNRKRK
jgi:hypothetical protein